MSSAAIRLKRHYREMSDKQTDELVEAVANLIVAYLKRTDGSVASAMQRSRPAKPNNNARRTP